MSSLSSGSLPRNASITDSTDSSNDSRLVRTIRQLPLPAVPGRVSDAVAPPVPAPHTAAASTLPLSGSLTAVQHSVGDLRAVPVLAAQELQLNAPAAAELPVAHIPRPSLPLPPPPQALVLPMSNPTPSTAAASTLSSSSPVVVVASTPAAEIATVAPNSSQAVLSVPSIPQAPAPFAASGLAVPALPPAVDTQAPAAASMDFPPPLPPPLRVPTPMLPVPTTTSLNNAAAAASFSLSCAYATTSLLPNADRTAASSSVPAALPVALPPSLVAPSPGNAAAAAPPNSALEPVAAPFLSVPNAPTKPRHLRRTRDVLERAECPLFTSPDRGSASTSASSSDSEEDDEAVYVGRTRRFNAAAARESERCSRQDRDAKDGGVPRDAPSPRHRSRSSHTNQKKKKRGHGQVVRMHEVEGKSAEAASREKTSLSSQSTNALTPDKVALQKGEKRTIATGAPPREAITEPSELRGEADTEIGTNVPLAFTSPAARFAHLCDTSNKNKGLLRHAQMRRLTPHSLRSGAALHCGDGGVEVEEDDDDEPASSDHAGAGMVRFRITGAFSDAASDSKMLVAPSAAIGGGGKQSRTQRESGEAQRDSNAGATVLALTVRGMSPLHADPGVVHPFVRVWVVSCVTGQSLVHASAAVPCAVTQPFDLRAHRTRAPWWEAKVALRLSPERLRGAASDAMVLLEVLDFGNETIHGFPQMRTGLYPICWGFLMLRDCTGRSTLNESENQHVQLFRYPQRTPWYFAWLEALLPFSWSAAGAYLLPTDLGNALGRRSSTAGGVARSDVPSVYYVFQSYTKRKLPYEGTMIVSLRQQSAVDYVPDTTDMLPYEEYLLSMLVSGGGSCAVPRSTHAASPDEDEINGSEQEARAMRARLASSVPASPWAQAAAENYYRMDGERSLLPHDVLQTTAVVGVVTCVAFTHNGTLFALGVYRSLQYLVELRNPLLPDMAVVATLLGHTAHLHRVVFQKEDRYLLSCSSDGTVRVWQPAHPNSPFTAEKCVGRSSVQCVCTLPHGFPIYAAIFHQEKIIAGGFSDQLLVWSYDRPLEGELNSFVTAAEESALHLTATFTPEFQTTQNDDEGGASRPARVLLGELIYRVDNAGALAEGGEPTITLSLASNERSNRVWSVHANGAVVCWRAVSEAFERGGRSGGNAGGSHNWQMSVRHRADCDGASEVQVCGSHAIVVCASAPLIFVFDATTCEQLRVVNTHLPPSTPVSLLPDGEAFVGAVGDQSKFVAWECFDGGLCTPATGYARAAPVFGVARMSWAESQQLAVHVSRSPCSEENMVRFVRGPASPAPGQSAAAFYYAQQEEQYRLEGIPAEMTLLTVAGTVRRRATVIQNGEGRTSGAFCAMFGGDLRAKRKAEYLAQRTQASRQQETERNSRRARLHQEALMADPTSAFAAATTTIPHDATEKGARMNAIINFWRGLVGQHKHRVEDLQRLDSGTVAAETPPPPRPFTHRALQYLDADGNETEV